MKKRLLLVFVLIFVFGCASPPEETTLEVPVQDIEESGEETVVSNKMAVPGEDVEEMVVEGELIGEEQVEEKQVPRCTREFLPKYSSGPHYLGSLFDAHFHMPNLIDPSKIDSSKIEGHQGPIPIKDHSVVDTNAELDRLLCNFEREKVRGAIGFTMGEEQLLEETVNAAKSMKARVGSKVNLFLSPAGFSATSLENIEVSNKGLFDGYGELSFGFGGGMQPNQKPDDKNFLDIYKVAGKHNIVVMIHVGAQQEKEIENILQKNSDVTFLFHGPESENFIHNIIAKYPNAYYSIDAMLIRLPSAPGALMYMVSRKDEFKTKFSQNYEVILDNTVKQWKSKIEQYPDRYMWGTDRSHDWMYDEDISALIEEFSRDFIAKLDQDVQEKFAYKNAESLIS